MGRTPLSSRDCERLAQSNTNRLSAASAMRVMQVIIALLVHQRDNSIADSDVFLSKRKGAGYG
jgi:hypothetical protein